ncbi:Piso0_000634 [Millerozyma farinosa CBS 7064]|uniref:Dolichyl-diphosphooligosaccharide--protein glycosyltransferase subunit WBP1 n=1 Tax=Pichia sorbitophila (strain ATCC MYA-4447 / BCRC 22081 / CBS 7064 / NBRC 10061 / NRRL Y-12695) TaxID=559304 RepID=G8YPM4_PICSO|nr:Piso0_000634 [Millerozyma farinosa CBS 7064]
MIGQRSFIFSILLAIVYILGIASAESRQLDKFQVLVKYDAELYNPGQASSGTPETTNLIKELQQRGYELSYESYESENTTLFLEGEPKYDHLVLLPSSSRTSGSQKTFNQRELLKFINTNGNILVVGDSDSFLPDAVRLLLNEIGIFPSPKGYKYVDHFNTKKGVPQITNSNIVNKHVLPELPSKGISYKGSSALLSNNKLAFPIIKGTSTSFTTNKFEDTVTEDSIWSYGEQGFLAVGFQALNNARLVWLGSGSLVNNEILDWVFQAKKVLKLQFVQHYHNDRPQFINPKTYRIKDNIFYTVGISEYVNGRLAPYKVDNDKEKLQIEFTMLDPYQRINLKPLGSGSSKGDNTLDTYIYYANFTIPDRHGIFTLDLDYKLNGLGYISDKRVVNVRHLANDEYKRSWEIPNSWFYVASASLVVVGWFFFIVNFLYISNTNIAKKTV